MELHTYTPAQRPSSQIEPHISSLTRTRWHIKRPYFLIVVISANVYYKNLFNRFPSSYIRLHFHLNFRPIRIEMEDMHMSSQYKRTYVYVYNCGWIYIAFLDGPSRISSPNKRKQIEKLTGIVIDCYLWIRSNPLSPLYMKWYTHLSIDIYSFLIFE